MIETVRSLVKRTFAYRLLRAHRHRSQFRKLSPDDRRRIEFYSRFVSKGDLVFDIGANLGNRTKAFLALGADVVAFEPQSRCADYLAAVLKGDESFTLVRAGMADRAGEATMRLSDATAISSLSNAWIAATTSTGRFGDAGWNEVETVRLMTFDAAIEEFGIPQFAKIDVEGFEFEVISGLTTPIPAMSLEFTPEYIANTFRCLEHVSSLGRVSGQISLGETLEFALDDWSDLASVNAFLRGVGESFGDVYLRIEDGSD